MSKRGKKFISFILALAIVFSALPQTFAGSEAQAKSIDGVCAGGETTSLIGTEQTNAVQENLPCIGDDFVEPEITVEEVSSSALSSAVNTFSVGAAADDDGNDTVYFDDYNELITYARAKLVAKEETVTVGYNGSETLSDKDLLDLLFAHTGVPNEGDYLYWQSASVSLHIQSSGGTCVYTIVLESRTTTEQEEELAEKIDEVLNSLHLSGKTDYQKVYAIYDYICQNVTYDYEHLGMTNYTLQYTAYAALINGTAVCQGFASLFYRMVLQAGVDTRLISGNAFTGLSWGAHGWNIVKLGNSYYNLDSTWDSGNSKYSYFLLGEETFVNHTADVTDDFWDDYPIAKQDYDLFATGECTLSDPKFSWGSWYDFCTATFVGDRVERTVDCTVDVQTNPATCTQNGEEIYTASCDFCGSVYSDRQTVTLYATGHDFVDGVCTVCGEKEDVDTDTAGTASEWDTQESGWTQDAPEESVDTENQAEKKQGKSPT